MRCWQSIGVGALLLTWNIQAVAAASSDEALIRGGRTVANTVCIGCHIVSPNQTLVPLYEGRLPSFENIANRPGLTAQSLRDLMASASWHNYALPQTLSPMSRISERDREQVVAFILSLKRSPSSDQASAPRK